MKKIVLILSVCFLVVLGLIIYLRLTATPVFSVEFFNVGQGDAALIKFDDGGKDVGGLRAQSQNFIQTRRGAVVF